MRALRLLHRHLPDLPAARRRTRRPARPHLPDQAGARGRGADARRRSCTWTAASPAATARAPARAACSTATWSTSAARIVESKVPRGRRERALRWALKEGLTSPLFGPAMKLGQAVRGLLPRALRRKVPRRRTAGRWPTRTHRAQGAAAGRLRAAVDDAQHQPATARVLDAAGIQTRRRAGRRLLRRGPLPPERPGRRPAQMRRNIDAWWPYRAGGEVEAIVMNASGCGVTVKEYGHLAAARPCLRGEGRAASATLTRDLSELLPSWLPVHPRASARAGREPTAAGVLAFHPPCTLQHGQKLRGGVEGMLALGFTSARGRTNRTCAAARPAPTRCCSRRSRTRCATASWATWASWQPAAILSANIGCITHLQSGTADARAALDRSARRSARALSRRRRWRRATRSTLPPPALAAHVHCPWLFEGEEAGVEQAVPPDGRCELIAHGARPYEERGSDGALARAAAAALRRPADAAARAALARRGRRARRSLHAGRRLGLRRRAAVVVHRRRMDLAALHGARRRGSTGRAAPSGERRPPNGSTC